MGNKSRFVIAESNIKSFFNKSPQKVFSREELRGIFEEKRGVWNLPISATSDKFIDQLIRREILKLEEIFFDGQIGKKQRFVAGDISVFQIASSIFNKSYLSHFSAVYLNGLTTQIPKTLYITLEQSPKNNVDRVLSQEAIDNAFSKPQRKSLSKAIYKGYTFVFHNGMNTNRLGVTTIENIAVTNLERTLIDITVRPGYAGGVHEVLETYKKAISQISMNKLLAILDTINFIYPYSQAIGFYLEKAGYEGRKLNELIKRKKDFNFYLTYEINDPNYSKEWKIYYPKGM